MLVTLWMFQWSAVRSAWRVRPKPALLPAMLLHLATETQSLSLRGWDVVKQMQILNFKGAAHPPKCRERQVGLKHLSIQPFFSLTVNNPRIEILSAQCFVSSISILLWCASWMLSTLLELFNLAGIKKAIHSMLIRRLSYWNCIGTFVTFQFFFSPLTYLNGDKRFSVNIMTWVTHITEMCFISSGKQPLLIQYTITAL